MRARIPSHDPTTRRDSNPEPHPESRARVSRSSRLRARPSPNRTSARVHHAHTSLHTRHHAYDATSRPREINTNEITTPARIIIIIIDSNQIVDAPTNHHRHRSSRNQSILLLLVHARAHRRSRAHRIAVLVPRTRRVVFCRPRRDRQSSHPAARRRRRSARACGRDVVFDRSRLKPGEGLDAIYTLYIRYMCTQRTSADRVPGLYSHLGL